MNPEEYSAEDIEQALSQIGITPNQEKLLASHYESPDFTCTAGELAEKVGYSDYSGANSQYGALGCKIREILHPNDKNGVGLKYLVSFGRTENGHHTWTLLPSVVTAIEKLGIARRNQEKVV